MLRNKQLKTETSDVLRPTGLKPRCLQIQLHIFPLKLTYFHISDLASHEILIRLGSYFVMFEKKPLETGRGPKGREIWEPKKVRSDWIHNFYSSPSITRALRSICTRMARNATRLKGITRQKIEPLRMTNIEARSCNHAWSGKAVTITYSECVFEACAILSTVTCPALKYFTTLSGTSFEKQLLNTKCDFFITFVWIISYSKKNWASYDQTSIFVFMQNTRYSCQILMKLEFSPQIFEEYSNIKFHENPSSGIKGVPCGHDETNSHLSKFFERD